MSSAVLGARTHHVSLSVANLNAEQAWYQQALGLTEVVERVAVPEAAVRTVVLQSAGGLRIELIERAGSARARSFGDPLDAALSQGYGHWAIEVSDVDQAFAELSAAGGQPVWPPAPAVRAGARFAYLKDPEGNLIELIESPASEH